MLITGLPEGFDMIRNHVNGFIGIFSGILESQESQEIQIVRLSLNFRTLLFSHCSSASY